jgi:hypothetical protein
MILSMMIMMLVMCVVGGEGVSTDDILPFFVWVVIQASPQAWYANLDHMDHFTALITWITSRP